MQSEETIMATWTLHAAYDSEAGVWYTIDCDVPGLVTEGETLERLRSRAAAVMPELLADNAALISPERREGPHQLRLVAFHESTVPIAA
jgi:predicted RNase H-like HicB family nuclease